MRRLFRIGVLCGVLTLLLCVSAFAAGENGIYGITQESGFSVTAEGNTGECDVDSDPATPDVTVYLDAVKVSVSYSNAVPDKQYLLFVTSQEIIDNTIPAVDNIMYIDQDDPKGSTTVTFSTVYPKTLKPGNTYYIYLISNDGNLNSLTLGGSFRYYVGYTLGDVNSDGSIDVLDAARILDHVVERNMLTGSAFLAADVASEKGIVDVLDAARILDYVVERIHGFN